MLLRLCSFQPSFCSSWQIQHALSSENCLFVITTYNSQVLKAKYLQDAKGKDQHQELYAKTFCGDMQPAAGLGPAVPHSLALAAVQHGSNLDITMHQNTATLLYHMVSWHCCCSSSKVTH